MFERIKRLYEEGRIDAAGVWRAVDKGWITREEAELILNNQGESIEETTTEPPVNTVEYYVWSVRNGSMAIEDVPPRFRETVRNITR